MSGTYLNIILVKWAKMSMKFVYLSAVEAPSTKSLGRFQNVNKRFQYSRSPPICRKKKTSNRHEHYRRRFLFIITMNLHFNRKSHTKIRFLVPLLTQPSTPLQLQMVQNACKSYWSRPSRENRFLESVSEPALGCFPLLTHADTSWAQICHITNGLVWA